MFCTRCGNRLNPADRFCPRCGAPAVQPVQPAQPAFQQPGAYRQPAQPGFQQPAQPAIQQPAPPAQPVYQQPAAPVRPVYQQPPQPVYQQPAPVPDTPVWVFQASKKTSTFNSIPCYVVFFRDHLVFAFLNPEHRKFENEKASQMVKAQGLGFFKGSAAMMKYWADYEKKYYAMNTAAVLADDPMNSALPYIQISEVLYRCYDQNTDADGDTSTTTGRLRFSFPGGLIDLEHTQYDSKSVRETLTGLFGPRLHYRR